MRDGPPMSAASLDRADVVVTTAALGIAQTGTITLVLGSGMGVAPGVWFRICTCAWFDPTRWWPPWPKRSRLPVHYRPISLVSGGTATSDIELVRVESVHGSQMQHVIILESLADA
jgi:L-lactate dehydrogenase complex protein LldG